MKILVTGAAGITGKAVINNLKEKSVSVRAMIHKESERDIVLGYGATEITVGDVRNPDDVARAVDGVDNIYHICSTANPSEDKIGNIIINEAEKHGVTRFVYHSVLHSILDDLPHHRRKLAVERMLMDSNLAYTIIQPAALMQNLVLPPIINEGVFHQKFFTNGDTRMNLVDLNDVAEFAAIALTETGFEYGTYEICGPQNLSLDDMTDIFSEVFNREVTPEFVTDEAFAAQMQKAGRPDGIIQTLLKMFHHYNRNGFMGNPYAATYLLGRNPKSLKEYLLSKK